jgi:hypothetical protein
MVVLAMLTLFAIVGVTFVLFADAAAQAARHEREAVSLDRPDMEPEMAFALFLGQMIYDTPDDELGVQSALRGHSFARTMYGGTFSVDPVASAGQVRNFYTGDNSTPWSGVGRLHRNVTVAGQAADDYNLVNYTWFRNDGFVRDPERLTMRALPTSAFGANDIISSNAPYTYCDANTMCLAYQDGSTGQIQVQSFHRPWLGFGSLDPANPNWTNPDPRLKYMVMRPRPAEHPNFPLPQDPGGDVKNLDGVPGGCDSIWIDIGAPVLTMPDGRKYKMLVAPLILDLDGRLNVNVVGNILGAGNTHMSNSGWGPWEVNAGKVLNYNATEWQNLFLGSSFANTTNSEGRYGIGRLPKGTAVPGGTSIPPYSYVDFNAMKDPGQAGAGTFSDPYRLAFQTGRTALGVNGPYPPWQGFPYFPPESYGNFVPRETTTNGVLNGTGNHPAMFNPLRPVGDNRILSPQAMHELLRFNGSGSEFVTSDLRLLANNLALDATSTANILNAQLRRNRITTVSFDLDRPGVIPYITDPNAVATQLTLAATAPPPAPTPLLPPQPLGTAPMTFPSATTRTTWASPPNSEFDPATWRSMYAALARVNLNRNLRDYPALTAVPGFTGAGVFNTATPAIVTQVQNATADRQQLAQDIFDVLRKATGAMDIATARAQGVNSPPYLANRWLAQLAVNIVDYIDEDDYMTPFHWDTGNTTAGDNGWVFGVEVPRLVLNEAYSQLDNDNSDPSAHNVNGNPTATQNGNFASKPYRLNTWLELHNPMPGSAQIAPAPNGATDAGGTVTITTTTPHGFFKGAGVTVAGVNDNRYNGNWTITNVPSPTTFTYTRGGAAPPASGGGVVVPGHIHGNPVAELQFGTTPIYQVVLSDPTKTNTALSNPANVTGDPNFTDPTTTFSTVNSWVPTATANANANLHNTVTPSAGTYADTTLQNGGFYVLGAQPPALPPGLPIQIASAREAGGTVTIVTQTPHGFKNGDTVTISNVNIPNHVGPGYNGTFTIAVAAGNVGLTRFTYKDTFNGAPVTGLPAASNNTGTAGEYHVNPGDNPNIPAYLLTPALSVPVYFAGSTPAVGPPNGPTMPAPNPANGNAVMPSVSVLLRRLACPHLPANVPGQPGYNAALPFNPYVTTDTMQLNGTSDPATTQVWDSRRYLPGLKVGFNNNNAGNGFVQINLRKSFGRIQPYASSAGVANVAVNNNTPAALLAQSPIYTLSPTPANQPQHTFYRHNAREDTPAAANTTPGAPLTLKKSFDWLTHFDRKLINTMELLNVSGVKPHELTSWFQRGCLVADTPAAGVNPAQPASINPSPHLVRWTTEDSRLYRFFEFVTTGSELATTGSFQINYLVGGRVPGRININTMDRNAREIFRAVVDGNPANSFNSSVGIATARVTGAANGGLTVRVTTTGPHGLSSTTPNQQGVTISGVSVAAYNGSFNVLQVLPIPNALASTTFTYTIPGTATAPPAPGTGGTANTTDAIVADKIFTNIMNQRTPGATPGATDQPILSLATGHLLASVNNPVTPINDLGLRSTLLQPDLSAIAPPATAPDWTTKRLLEPDYSKVPGFQPNLTGPATQGKWVHPYQRAELLTKIMNNFTTRSNTFAVWATVGFFEVTDDTTRPVTLGAEIGRSENRHVRHRMFAIFDRTQLQAATTTTKAAATVATAAPNPDNVVFPINNILTVVPTAPANATGTVNTSTNLEWTIKVGTVLTFQPNTNSEESATVFADPNNAGALSVRLFRTHASGSTVAIRGNPGPWFRFDPRSSTTVVPYFAMID